MFFSAYASWAFWGWGANRYFFVAISQNLFELLAHTFPGDRLDGEGASPASPKIPFHWSYTLAKRSGSIIRFSFINCGRLSIRTGRLKPKLAFAKR
jgi:hypothetical protein